MRAYLRATGGPVPPERIEAMLDEWRTPASMKSVYEVKEHLPELVDRAARGEEIVIARKGVAVAKLVPVTKPSKQSRLGRGAKPALRLDPNAPGLDDETRRRRRALADLQRMTPTELFQLAVRAGIYTKTGRLTKHYRSDAAPSASRPTD